ncbi:MAG TPA: MurR/RpiR family transcriptional regulator [Methylibium sp.]
MSSAQSRVEAAAADASPSLSRVGQWIAAHPIQTLSHSAEEIAELTGTSVAAVNRFSRAAGFDGFGHLKSVLGEELQSAVEPLRKLDSRGRKEGKSAIDGHALDAAGRVPEVQRAAGRLLKAQQVWVLGMGASSHLAGYAAHVLMPYLPRVWAVAGEGGTEEAARRLSRCGRADVLVAISLPRYSRDTVRLAAFARERGARVIAITDAPTAPLAAMADALLLAPSEHAVMPSSALGALAVIEALAAAVMRLNPDAARIARELSDAVVSHLAAPATSPSASRKKESP